MKKVFADRRLKLVRNILFIVLGLLIFWSVLGMPVLTRTQAFRRAMREHFLTPQDPEVFFGEDGGISALAKVDDIYVQTRVMRTGIRWEHGLWSETEATDGAFIIPLFAYGQMIDSPEVAVLAEGERAELTFICEDGAHPMFSMGKQDGWFLFRFVRNDDWKNGDSPVYSHFLRGNTYMHLGTPNAINEPCSFVLVTYDENGTELLRTEKKYY